MMRFEKGEIPVGVTTVTSYQINWRKDQFDQILT